jgi:hypothetical protein
MALCPASAAQAAGAKTRAVVPHATGGKIRVVTARTKAGSATVGTWTQAQVNTAIQNGVAYLDSQQNSNGSIGMADPIAETGLALVAYGVLANGTFSSLSATYQTHVKNAISWLLSQQDTSSDANKGSWADGGEFFTYSTGSALAGLSYFQTVDAAVPAAITLGRNFLITTFNGTGCSTANSSSTAYYCGGWNYQPNDGLRSDESNTGYAMFGLHETGGVPAAIQSLDAGWQNNIQSDTTSNPAFSGSYDVGGGSYQPRSIGSPPYSDNANDTGSMLFSYGYDAVAATDPRVMAGETFAQDVLNEYELEQGTSNADSMVYFTGTSSAGTCTIGSSGCDWSTDPGEGGFHYSMFSLTKGLGSYITPSLTDHTNWYAQVVDLLLSQQGKNGSWPVDGRDDASIDFATSLAVAALGLVGVTPPPPPPTSATNLNDVIQVETSPSSAGSTVDISSPQLQKSCASLNFETLQGGSPASPKVSANSIGVVLDADGNATVVANGVDCIPGRYRIISSAGSTHHTATTTLIVDPPQITFPDQVAGYPANEVETGNTPASGHSDVSSVFSVETSPLYAGQPVEISSSQLVGRCGQGSRWESNATGSPFVNSSTATAIIDNDGNAEFTFKGASCAAGASKVNVQVEAGKHPKYKTTYIVDPPAVTYTGPKKGIFVSASPDPLISVGG